MRNSGVHFNRIAGRMWLWASHTGVNGTTLASMHVENGSMHGLALGYGMAKSIPWIRVSLLPC